MPIGRDPNAFVEKECLCMVIYFPPYWLSFALQTVGECWVNTAGGRCFAISTIEPVLKIELLQDLVLEGRGGGGRDRPRANREVYNKGFVPVCTCVSV